MSQFIEMFGGIQNNTKWPLKSIGEICEMVNGYTFKSTKYSNQGYSIIRIANVQKGIIEDEDKVYYPEEYKSEFAESILKEGDILMSLTGNVGRVGVIYEQHLPAALNQRVQGLRIKDSSQINHQYLFSLLNLDDFETLCIKNASGSAQLNLSTVWLRNCKIVCPPIQEQEHFAKIAEQADKSKFVGFKSQFIEMFGGIQNNTKWPLKSIGEICEMVNGYTFKSTKYSNQGYSIIRIANVQKGIIEDEDKVYYPEEYKSEFAESILKEGDILMSLTGNVGRVGVIYEQHLPAALNQRVQGLRIKDSSQINHQYLFSLLNLDDFETLCIKNASGSAQLNLSTVWLRNCKIVCPPIQEQEHFAKIAEQADKSKLVLLQIVKSLNYNIN